MNTSEWNNISIMRALLEKLPTRYENIKNTPITDFDWNFVDTLRIIVEKEMSYNK